MLIIKKLVQFVGITITDPLTDKDNLVTKPVISLDERLKLEFGFGRSTENNEGKFQITSFPFS